MTLDMLSEPLLASKSALYKMGLLIMLRQGRHLVHGGLPVVLDCLRPDQSPCVRIAWLSNEMHAAKHLQLCTDRRMPWSARHLSEASRVAVLIEKARAAGAVSQPVSGVCQAANKTLTRYPAHRWRVRPLHSHQDLADLRRP